MTTKSSHRSRTPKPVPGWMQNADATPLERTPPPKTKPAPLATPGEYSEEAERQFRAKAWEALDQATQDAAQDEDDPGHSLATDEYALAYNAVVADDKASSLTAQYGQR